MYYVPFLKDCTKLDVFIMSATRAHTANAFWPHIGQEDRLSVSRKELLMNEIVNEAGGCNYIRGLSYYLFMTIVSLNNALTTHLKRFSHYEDAISYLRKTSNLLIRLVSNTFWHRDIFRIVYRTVPRIEIHFPSQIEKNEIPNYLRLVYAVLFEVNAYILKHCRIPGFNYWYPLNIIHLSVMGRFSLVDREISQAWDTMKSIGKRDHSHKYLRKVSYFIDRQYSKKYEQNVLFNWKSEKKNIGYIERSTRTVILSSSYSFVFYDIRIKYFVAITFYEINEVYNRVVSNEITEGSWCNKIQQLLNRITRENLLPFEYQCILDNVYIFVRLIVDIVSRKNNDGPSMNEQFETIIQRIVDQFTRIGVSFVTANSETITDKGGVKIYFENILFNIGYLYESAAKILNSTVNLNV